MAKSKLEKLERKAPYVPSSDDPLIELRTLVMQHKAITKASVAISNMSSDRVMHETGEVLKCRLPEDVKLDLQETAKRNTKRGAQLESAMLRELKKVPIYKVFLRHVYGLGPIIAAYLVAEVDIKLATKPSSLRMFCGMAVVDGSLVRRTKGQKNTYNGELRTRLFQMMGAMQKNCAKSTAERPSGSTTKYLQVWENYKHRAWQTGRVTNLGTDKQGGPTGKIVNGAGKTVSARGFINSTGWHKAADVFLCDLYTVWRALEGLPVWPTYVEWITGFKHGGQPIDAPRGMNVPREMTLEQAIEEVGNVGAIARQALMAAE